MLYCNQVNLHIVMPGLSPRATVDVFGMQHYGSAGKQGTERMVERMAIGYTVHDCR